MIWNVTSVHSTIPDTTDIQSNEITDIQNNNTNIQNNNTKNNNSMDAFFSNREIKLDSCLTLSFKRTLVNNTYVYKTILKNRKSNKELLLNVESFKNNSSLEFFDERGENPLKLGLFSIAGTILNDKDLYIVFNRFGTVSLHKYSFTDTDKYTEDVKIILHFFVTPALGMSGCGALMKKIGKDIYMLISSGQAYSAEKIKLMKINTNKFSVSEIIFKDNCKVAIALFVEESAKEYIAQLEQERERNIIPLDKQEQEFLTTIKTFPYEGYFFRELSCDKKEMDNQISEFSRMWLGDYHFFDENYFCDENYQPKKINIEQTTQIIQEVLDYLLENKIVKLVDVLADASDTSIVYFFYLDDTFRLKIIRYCQYRHVWFVGDYIEEEIIIDN